MRYSIIIPNDPLRTQELRRLEMNARSREWRRRHPGYMKAYSEEYRKKYVYAQRKI